MSKEADTQEQANKIALQRCNDRTHSQGIKAGCRLYAVGDFKIANLPDALLNKFTEEP